jgi:hypothetical protein
MSVEQALSVYEEGKELPYALLNQQVARYGVTADWYLERLRVQSGVCAICGKPERHKRRKRLSVDHDHETGEARALLCGECNTGLRFIEKGPKWVKAAQTYLKMYGRKPLTM